MAGLVPLPFAGFLPPLAVDVGLRHHLVGPGAVAVLHRDSPAVVGPKRALERITHSIGWAFPPRNPPDMVPACAPSPASKTCGSSRGAASRRCSSTTPRPAPT